MIQSTTVYSAVFVKLLFHRNLRKCKKDDIYDMMHYKLLFTRIYYFWDCNFWFLVYKISGLELHNMEKSLILKHTYEVNFL